MFSTIKATALITSEKERDMIRILLIVLLLFFKSAHAQAQEEVVLVQNPPMYSLGDKHDGYVYIGTERIAQLHQTTVRGESGAVLIRGEHITPDGKVQGYFMSNPLTMLGMSMFNREEQLTLTTTCSLAKMYPIIFGKTYICESIQKTDDRTFTAIDEWKHNEVMRNDKGNMVAICGVHIHRARGDVTTIRFCSTPDGKWTDKMYINLPRKGEL